MSNFVPHDQYRGFITNQLHRVRQSAEEAPKWAVGVFGGGLLVILMALSVGPLGILLLLFLAPVAYFAWKNDVEKRVLFDKQITCPHCEARLDLARSFICGTCGQQNEPEKFFGIAVSPCSHCSTEPHSLMCANCGNDIVFDLEAYNKAEKVGFGFAGTRKLL